MSDTQKQRLYLEDVMSRTGWTQTQLAQRAGLDPSTLSRFLTSGRDGHALRDSTMRKIARAANMSWGDEPAHAGAEGFSEAEAMPLEGPARNNLEAVLTALAAGGQNVDPWVLNSAALEGAGYKRGDVLLVKLGETARPGDVVCAQAYDWTKGRAETLFRIFQPPYLVAASGDPAYLRPFLADDSAIVIRGVVLHSIRSRSE